MENIVTIESDKYSAKVNISKGANCISLRNDKYDAIILREPDYSKEIDNPYIYGMPILFPPNRISGGKFEFEGREYNFPINEQATGCHLHGKLHTLPFEINSYGKNFVECIYNSDENYNYFPHKFTVTVKYTITGNGLLQETKITNLSDKNMPNFLGFHTTFNIQFTQNSNPLNVRVFADVDEEIERDTKSYIPTGNIIKDDIVAKKLRCGSFAPFKNQISKHYKSRNNGDIILFDTQNNIKVIYENDENFKWRLFYNGNGDEYICLEPQTCMVNCPNTPFDRDYTGFDSIAPFSSKKYTSKIYIKED